MYKVPDAACISNVNKAELFHVKQELRPVHNMTLDDAR